MKNCSNILLLLAAAGALLASVQAQQVPTSSEVTAALQSSGNYSRFLSLLSGTGITEWYLQQVAAHPAASGLTIFAPEDAAFGRMTVKQKLKLAALAIAELKGLLQAHAALNFYGDIMSWASETVGMPLPTLFTPAGNDSAFALIVNVSDAGAVMLNAGLNEAVVLGGVFIHSPLAVFRLDQVLMPDTGVFS